LISPSFSDCWVRILPHALIFLTKHLEEKCAFESAKKKCIFKFFKTLPQSAPSRDPPLLLVTIVTAVERGFSVHAESVSLMRCLLNFSSWRSIQFKIWKLNYEYKASKKGKRQKLIFRPLDGVILNFEKDRIRIGIAIPVKIDRDRSNPFWTRGFWDRDRDPKKRIWPNPGRRCNC